MTRAGFIRVIKKGFTLIELMVVVGVIATLSTVGFFGLSRMQAVARDTQRTQVVNGVRAGLTRYQGDKGFFPWGGFSNVVNMAYTNRYFAGLPVDPGCGGGPATFPAGALSNADWQPCPGKTAPGYSYALGTDNKYTIFLRREAGGELAFGPHLEGAPVPTHKACSGMSCASVVGPDLGTGEVGCSSDNDCSHLECVPGAGTCSRVAGPASQTPDKCSTDNNCKHLACGGSGGLYCTLVNNQSNGQEPGTCSGDNSCSYAGCVGAACGRIAIG